MDRYVELRSSGVISRQTLTSEKRYAQYVEATIGDVALRLLSSEDVERCILAAPRLSKKWALEKRREYEENIKTISVILGHATPSYTLDLYVGYMPSTSAELSNRYMGRVGMDAA